MILEYLEKLHDLYSDLPFYLRESQKITLEKVKNLVANLHEKK